MLDDRLLTEVCAVIDEIARATPRAVQESRARFHARVVAPSLVRRFVATGRATAREIEVASLVVLYRPAAHCPFLWLVQEVLAKANATRAPAADVALAYAAGWGRGRASGDERWDGPWPSAIQDLVNAARPVIKRACRRIRGIDVSPDRLEGWAVSAAMDFLAPQPPRAAAYARFQSIRTWDPAKRSLRGWLRHALLGSGSTKCALQVNWFRNGLLYPLMEADRELSVTEVAFRRCCNVNALDAAAPVPCRHESEYSHDPCEKCGAPFRADGFEVFSKPRLVAPGRYAFKSFTSCPHELEWLAHRACPCCDRLGPSTWRCGCANGRERDWQAEARCPKCGRDRPPRARRALRWRCGCQTGARGTGRQSHDWHLDPVCVRCGAVRPNQPTWVCTHHGFERGRTTCPGRGCGRNGSQRPAQWAVREDLAPADRPGSRKDLERREDDASRPPDSPGPPGPEEFEDEDLRRGLAAMADSEREVLLRYAGTGGAAAGNDGSAEGCDAPSPADRRLFRKAIRKLKEMPAFVARLAGRPLRPEGGRP